MNLKPMVVPLLVSLMASPQGNETEEAFRAAIRKLREPLDEDQAFNVTSSMPGRFATMRRLSTFLGRRAAHDAIDQELERSPGHAFETVEKYRSAREGASLLARLQSEKARLTPESSLDLKWITNQLKAVNLLRDRAQLGSPELDRLEAERSELQNQRWTLHNRHYVGRSGPLPITSEAVQAALDPGTVVLSYFTAQSGPAGVPIPGGSPPADHIDLVVLSRGSPVTAHRIALPEDELRRLIYEFLPARVRVFGRGVQRLSDAPSHSRREAEAGERLYQALIAPAEKAIAESDRVLVIPDGLLYELPFAALRRRDKSGAGTYLVEWKPVHVAQSIAIYLELLAQRDREDRKAAKRGRQLVAFGDPVYGNEPGSDGRAERLAPAVPMAVRSAVHRGLATGLARLPGTSREVGSIAELFRAAGAPAEVLLRSEASERAAKERTAKATYLHFALHGVLDPDQHEHSYLALALPGAPAIEGEDGILEAWEVGDQMGLAADLVTLSACETALGRPDYGEGVLSMGHAFQMAGAQSVAASLWQVADDSTADLMVRFYRNLLNGLSKDRALQEAQVAMLRGELGPDRAAPYNWAAFQLFGDWR